MIETTHILGKKWAIAILTDIRFGKFKGFYQFTLKTKITPRMLSKQLKELEKAELLKKNANTNEYSLTKKSQEILQILDKVKKWNIKWNNVPQTCLNRSCTECNLFLENKATN